MFLLPLPAVYSVLSPSREYSSLIRVNFGQSSISAKGKRSSPTEEEARSYIESDVFELCESLELLVDDVEPTCVEPASIFTGSDCAHMEVNRAPQAKGVAECCVCAENWRRV